jgi:hypothetical protein
MGYREIRKDRGSSRERFKGKHRFEHWYVDNSVYFITSKVRDGYHAFESVDAKRIVRDWREYPDTRANVEKDRAIRRAVELEAFLETVPYARYEKMNLKRR